MMTNVYKIIGFLTLVAVTSGCSQEKRTAGDGGGGGLGDIQRVGSVEQFIQFEAPKRADIIFMFDTSPSMHVVWGDAGVSGMTAWFDMMKSRAENVPASFDYFMYGSTPNFRSDRPDQDIIGGNGDHFFFGTTSSPDFKEYFIQGLRMISAFTYPPHVAVYDALIAIMDKFPHHRRTVPLEIVFFGDVPLESKNSKDQDHSTKSLDAVISVIKKYRAAKQVGFHIFVKDPGERAVYCSDGEVIYDIETTYKDSAPEKMMRFRNHFDLHAYVIDRFGSYGCSGEPFNSVFEKFGAQSRRPLDQFALGTNVTQGITNVEIDGSEVPPDAYDLVFDAENNYYIKFLTGPPPPGSNITVQYR